MNTSVTVAEVDADKRWLDAKDLLFAQPGRPVCEALSHAQLCQNALQLAAQWQASRLRRIALSLEDVGELATALLAAWRAGIEVVLPADASPATRARLAAEVDHWFDALPAANAAPLPAARLDLDACRLVLWTSGSSGVPKAMPKTLRQLDHEVRALERLWGAQLGAAVILASVSARHIYGLLFRLLWPLCAGRVTGATAIPFPEHLQQASLATPAFAWVTSPALLTRMGETLDWPALRRVRQVFSSGGALAAEVAATLHARLGQFPTEIYGSSETGGIAWRQGGQAWQPFAGVELGTNAEGALRVTSPYLPEGHVEHTADAVELLEDGRFLLRGRLDRIVKLEQKRIALPALEQALMAHPWVADVRLGVVQHGRAILGALLAPTPAGLHTLRNQGRRVLVETLRMHLAASCDPIALPRRWRFLGQLPYNAQGKLVQAEVEALLAAPRPTRPRQHAVRQGEDGDWQFDLTVPLDLAYFSGHFPQVPVLPGVVQIDWAQHLACQVIPGLLPRFAGMEVLKFQQLIRPGDSVQLRLNFAADKGKLSFAFTRSETACSSGRIVLNDENGFHTDA